ncbi:hypothetical protein QYE76_042046 [Lolium multiflorum]|uniref:Zinc finger, CCHC-type n=1 Tax=Lolium multiflorum TaxID=4521 RepID=A0AAD8WWY1_LOLMU|nr:hypothetical protein QYE76_042046 [Lolium multiflorum]
MRQCWKHYCRRSCWCAGGTCPLPANHQWRAGSIHTIAGERWCAGNGQLSPARSHRRALGAPAMGLLGSPVVGLFLVVTPSSNPGRPPLFLHHTLFRLGEALQLFFLHHHHHAVVLLEFGGDLPHLRCPLERGEEGLHRHRTRDRIMAPPSINFNQFLEKEKLKSNGSNFTDWFRHCAILCSLEAELQKRFEHHDPCEMMRELKVIFETHAAVESYEASKHFFGCMMEEGSSVSEHVFAMSGHAKKLSDLGIVIPNQLGIHRVLQSLPPSYKNFVMNYNMQNMNKELPELFSMLKSAEVEIKKENQVLMVNKTTSFKKQGKPNKGNFKKGGKKVARLLRSLRLALSLILCAITARRRGTGSVIAPNTWLI